MQRIGPRTLPAPAPSADGGAARAGTTTTATAPTTTIATATTATATTSQPAPAGAAADQALATSARDAQQRLTSTTAATTTTTKRAPWAVARGGVGAGEGLSGGARAMLSRIGVRPDDVARFAAGECVLFTQPTKTGDDTIGTVRRRGDVLEATIISVHDVGGGVKALLGFREQARDLGRALSCQTVELGGAAVINAKLEDKLQRLGFVPGRAAVPDELGNVDDMMVYRKTFALHDDGNPA